MIMQASPARHRRRVPVQAAPKAWTRAGVTLAVVLCGSAAASPLQAQTLGEDEAALLDRLQARLEVQEKQILEQTQRLERQQARIEALEAERLPLAGLRGMGPGRSEEMQLAQAPPNVVTEGRADIAPVAEAQRPPAEPEEVAALPSNIGVLTPPGQLVLDPSMEYVRTSNNRLVFRGVEIVPGIPLGVIEASDAARDTGVATLAARYGVTDRIEVEARLPYVWRHDSFSLLARADPQFDEQRELREQGLGDVELAARYQLNSGAGGLPVFVGNLRVKAPTGKGPYELPYDEFGVAMGLATGSGFWSAETGVTMLYPTDPAIIFGGLTYLHNFGRDIDKQLGPNRLSRVEPGDAIGAQAGFGLSLNPRFSVSLGYSHNYIFPTKSEIGGASFETQALQVGAMQMGWSFRLTEKVTLNNSFEFGVTSDAPDLRVVLRAPVRF